MQKVIIIGNLTKDPELNNGVAKFSVAVNEKYNGNESTEYFNCVAFKQTAENVSKYLAKGSKVYVEGKQQTKEYEGKYYTSLLVHSVEFLGKPINKTDNKPQVESQEPDFEDEIPF